MATADFSARTDAYRRLMGSGLSYAVPRFQRDYSWGRNEWDELWRDVLAAAQEPSTHSHYMGYLVLQSRNDREFAIIDGQQRLTTLTLLVLAGMQHLHQLIKEGSNVSQNEQRVEQLRQSYIGQLDPVSLVSHSKLTLNRNDDGYFQNYIVPLKSLPRQRLTRSEKNLRQAFEWFCTRICEHVKCNGDDPGRTIAELIERMSDKLIFTIIMITDELNAYKVFETLNARGVKLSATDLLKNYLFSLIDRGQRKDRELDALDDRWGQITDRLGEGNFPDFLRSHWISRVEHIRQAELFRKIRSKITSREDAFGLLERVDEDVDPYLEIVKPGSASELPPEQGKLLDLLQIFQVRQPIPLLLAARRRLDGNGFLEVLKAVFVVSFRYNVIGNLQAGEQETVYHRQALKIERQEFGNVGEVIDGFAKVYPKDDSFKAMFAEKELSAATSRNRQVVRYILCELERERTGQPLDYKDGSISLEHIFPLNPLPEWDGCVDADIDSLTARIGNMTLLENARNRDAGNAPYKQKLAAYRESSYQISKGLAERHEEWTPDSIKSRQTEMAKKAAGIWRIARLH